MAPRILKQRFTIDTTAATTKSAATTNAVPTTPRTRQETKKARAKRALKSLAVAISVPVCVTITIIVFFGSSPKYSALPKPSWLPPLWLVHSASVASSFLMGFAAWLVWAEGGFHSKSDALPLYASHLTLGLTWNPLVLNLGAVPIAFVFSVIHLVSLVACYRSFKAVNPLAGDLVRPCLAWLAFLTFVNYKLIDLL